MSGALAIVSAALRSRWGPDPTSTAGMPVVRVVPGGDGSASLGGKAIYTAGVLIQPATATPSSSSLPTSPKAKVSNASSPSMRFPLPRVSPRDDKVVLEV